MELKIIDNVRGYLDDNQTAWLNLEDVAKGLGFTQTKYGSEYVRWERVHGYLNEIKFSTNGEHEPYIPENIFYRLAMKANNEVADKFQEKIANEVLPSIRKNGGYIINQNGLTDSELMAKALILAQTVIDSRNKQIEQLQPKADFFDTVTQSDDLIDIGQVAKIINVKGVGRNKLFEILRNLKVLDQHNNPYQKYIDSEYFKVVEVPKLSKGVVKIYLKTCVYQKGLNYIRKLVG